ncbi:hypothetical protein Droror1_Dr00025982 [Drosera rotundifolia]
MAAATNHCRLLRLFLFILLFTTTTTTTPLVSSNAIFSLKYRYEGTNRSLNSLRAHDTNRLRMFSDVDLPLGGSGTPDSSGLYYARIGIGTPSKSYYMQVDTGADVTWVNCIQCTDCPQRGYHGIELTLYDPKDSLTSRTVSCGEKFCMEVSGGLLTGCAADSNLSCNYAELYGDGGSSTGYFVNDIIQYGQISGDLQTTASNGSVSFGCSAGEFLDQASSDYALDGLLGFGKSNWSTISQLALSGRVSKMFAHCLDGENGGGIFAIGQIVKPKVNTTNLIPSQPHYNVNLTAVKVGDDYLSLPSNIFEAGGRKGAIIDCGTTLAYLPAFIYEPLVSQILAQQPSLDLRTVQDLYSCFQFSESLDDGFPNVTFYFQNSLQLEVLPHEYLFPVDNLWCIGWQNSGNQSRDKMNLTLFGDLVLLNKLVLYDLENQTIGWTPYNCSSSIEVKDEQSGTVHLVGAQDLPTSASSGTVVPIVTGFLLVLLGCCFWSPNR